MPDINDWMRGDGSDALKGTDNASDIDANSQNYLQDPLDRLLTNYYRLDNAVIASNSTLTIGIGEVVCSNSGGTVRRFRKNTATITVDITASGNLGLDTGTEASSTMYYIYATADADATTFSACISASATSPTGFTYFKKIGAVYNNGSSNFENAVLYGHGAVVQVVSTQTGATASGSTAIPADDTIPQNTEGDQFLTLSIAPTSATNKLKIDVCLVAANSGVDNLGVALFQDAVASALASVADYGISDAFQVIRFTHFMTAGTTSVTTFKVRSGASGGTTYINGNSGGRRYGGSMASSITITEIKV